MASLVEDSLIKTCLIEQVVAPMTAHICYLTLLSETTDISGNFIQLEASAQAVAKTTRHMADVASRFMTESDDDIMRLEMSPLLEPLMVSGQHVLLATQKLSIQPQIRAHREELIEAMQNVLLGVVKILLVEDDATVRNITAASDRLLNYLQDVGNATDIPSLLEAFQAFSKEFLLLHTLLMGRVKDLRDHRQQDGLKISVEILRKSISMLHTATYTTIKHPTSEAARHSKMYILQLLESTINDIIMMLKGNSHWMSTGFCGYYTEKRNRLLKLVSDPGIVLFKDTDFDVVLRDLVFHSMAVAKSSQREIGSCLSANCKLVLQLWSEISQQIKQINRHFTDKQEPQDHQEKLCVSLTKQIHEMDEAVVKATLYQIIDAFVVTSSPLEQLINTVHNLLEADLENGLDLDPIQTLLKTFLAHADRIVEVAGFVSALTTDERSLERVEHSISCLLQLTDGVTLLLLDLKGDSVQCHGALHKLINFQQKWRDETEQLLNAFCDVINVKDFIHLSVQEMKCDLEKCREAHKSQDHQLLNRHTRLLFGRMSQVVQLVRRCVDKSDDPIYRNGLLVLVKQAEVSAGEVTAHATDLFNNNFQDEVFLLLVNSITVAIKNFDILHEGLDGLEHPHLLSPLREGARQTASSSPVACIKEAKTTTNDLIKSDESDNGDEKEDSAVRPKVTLTEKESPELTITHQFKITEAKNSFIMDSKSVGTSHSADLLPLLSKVVNLSKAKNIEALNVACIQIMELSSCYTQATKEAASIVEQNDHQETESLRSKLVTLTPLLVQAAQETAMSSVNIIDTVYKHSAQFSNLIKSINSILLPVTGMWFHGIKAMIHSHADMVDTSVQELTEVMCLCADTVELVASTDIKLTRGDDSIASILNKLQKAQTNTKKLTDLLVSKTGQVDELDGPCILWALSIQVLLSSLDRILGTRGRGKHQMTPKKWLAAMSEYSLRIQEAAWLSSINCRDSSKAKLLKGRDDVKALSTVYLQATEDLGTVSMPSILRLARTKLLHRQLQIKMKSLCCLLSKVNEEYVTAIQNIVSLACSTTIKDCLMEADVHDIHTQFDATADSFLNNVKIAAESVQDCLNFMRDPRERSNLRFISDHLSFQMSEIVSRAKIIMETQTIYEMLSIDIQTQCWAAKAHHLVDELYKVEGIFPATKEQIKLGLQGKAYSGDLQTDKNSSTITTNTKPPRQVTSEKTNPVTIPRMNQQKIKTDLSSQESSRMPMLSSMDPTLTYTSLFLKQEAEQWDGCGNQIVSVTKEMADKIQAMTQYLKRKGPITNKDAFVSSASNLVLNCQTITRFLKVIADHCLDQHSAQELCILLGQISTITNQLTIISSVNAVTPACKSSDEILVKNAQNLLQTVIQGVRAAETACIKGLRQPEPNSEAADAAYLCIQWKKNLLIHRTQEKLNPETDDLGLRKTSLHPATPSLAPPISVLKKYN